MSELKTLFPTHETVTMGERTVKIYQVKLKNMADYSQSAGDLIALLADPTALKVAAYGAKNNEKLTRLLKANTSLSRWQISRLDASEAILIGYQVVRVNFDFFARALPVIVASLPDGDELLSDS